jgi:hypothetical protein
MDTERGEARPGIAARFPGVAEARRAIEALENAGIDGNDIALLGRSAAARTPGDPKASDRRVGRYLLPRLALGVGLGAVVGALGGLVVGVVVAAVTAGSTVGVVAACGIVGLCVGGVLGTFFSFERSVGLSDAWPETFDAPDEPVWVGVFGHDHERGRITAVLERRGPTEVR